jgi:simple sugar transport system substrate-binding protein
VKRSLAIMAASAVALAALSVPVTAQDESPAASDASGFQLAQRIQDAVASGEQLELVYVTNNTSIPYAKPQEEGVKKAAEELGVNAYMIGPNDGLATGQISQIQTLIAQGNVDGFAVASTNNDAIKPILEEAVAAGIPIISAFTNNPGSAQLAYIGTELKKSGVTLGEELLKVLDGKTGKVIVVSQDAAAGWSTTRFEGFKEALEGSGLEIVGPINVGIEPAQELNFVQNAMTADPDAIAIASVDCCSFVSAAQWVAENDKAGDIVVVGFDALQSTLNNIQDGVVAFALSQQPAAITHDAITMLYDYLVNGVPLADKIMDVAPVTKENAADFLPEG